MTAAVSRSKSKKQPRPVLYALVFVAVNAVGGVIFTAAWPDLDDRGTMFTVSIVIAVLMLATALWLWTGAKWGGITTIVIQGLNVLLALPGLFTGESGLIIGGVVSGVLSAITIWLVLTPAAWGYWRGA